MFDVGRLIARISLEGMQTFGRDLRQVGTEFRKLDEEGRRAATDIGQVMAGVGASVLATGALAAKAAIDWESAWAGVTKTVSGTPAELAAVEDGLRELTKTMPAAHAEIAAVAEAAGQLGVKTGDVVAFTQTMIELGETTNLSANEAATELARFMNVMGTAPGEIRNLGAAIVGLGNNYATTEAEIVSMAQRLSGAGRQIGLTEGEVLGLATSLSSVGIEAEAGGSAISKVMIDIAASVDSGGERLDKFARVSGMSAKEFAAAWQTDPGVALAAFVSGLANAESQGQSTLGMLEELEITEVRMRDALLRSAAASDQFAGAMAMGNDEMEKGTALSEEAAKRFETLESKIAIMWNAVVDLGIVLGESLTPAIEGATESVTAFAGFIGALPEPMSQAVFQLGLGVGALALFGGAALIAIPKIVEFRLALQVLSTQMPTLAARLATVRSFMMGPWGIALAAGTLAVVGLEMAIDSLKATSAEMDNALRNAASAQDMFAVAAQGVPIERYDLSLKNLSSDLELLGEASRNVWTQYSYDFQKAAIPRLQQIVQDFGDELGTLAQTDMPAAQSAFQRFADSADLSDDAMIAMIDNMVPFRDALTEQATALGINLTALSDTERQQALLEIALSETAVAADGTVAPLDESADASAGLAESTAEAAEAMDALWDKMTQMSSGALSARETTRQFEESLRTFDETLKENGNTFDITTAKGAENEAALDAIAESALAAAEAVRENGGSEEEYTAKLQAGRDAIAERLRSLDVHDDKINELVESILRMPEQRETDLIVNDQRAREGLDQFIRSWDGKRITFRVDTVSGERVYQAPGGPMRFQADGGVVQYFAGGGFSENHVAQIASAGTMRVWAEPETGGEAYIPMSPNKRGRSTDILATVADEFGYSLMPKGAQGGASLAGVRIDGTLDLGDGLYGRIRGVVVEEMGTAMNDLALDAQGGSNL